MTTSAPVATVVSSEPPAATVESIRAEPFCTVSVLDPVPLRYSMKPTLLGTSPLALIVSESLPPPPSLVAASMITAETPVNVTGEMVIAPLVPAICIVSVAGRVIVSVSLALGVTTVNEV